ncbi:hypothetical protein TB2_031938 [Malus domestica]
MKKLGKNEGYLIPTDLSVSSFSRAITITHGILPLEVDLGSKQIILAFFVVDNSSTYEALLGRDWIHQSLFIPSTLHKQVVVYHEEIAMRPGFWEMVEAKSLPFFPTTNVAEASFYNPNIGILQCLGADENGCPTKTRYRPKFPTPVMSEKRKNAQVVVIRSLIKRLLVYGKRRKQERESSTKEEKNGRNELQETRTEEKKSVFWKRVGSSHINS